MWVWLAKDISRRDFLLPRYRRAVPLIDVRDATDPRLSDYVSLRDASLRRSIESAGGLFIAEGEKVVRRATQAGYRPRSFLLARRWLGALEDVLARFPDVPVYVADEALTEQVTGFHVHRGALASLHRQLRHSAADVLALRRVVVLEDIVDHTNVGAILRCAAGLGWDGVLLAPRCADPLYRRSIKVAMGAAFTLPWARLASWEGAVADVREAGFVTVAMALDPRAVSLEHAARVIAEGREHARIALLLGTEGAGLSQRWMDAADLVVRIPMSAGVDSLNVAAAAAIACYRLGPSRD